MLVLLICDNAFGSIWKIIDLFVLSAPSLRLTHPFSGDIFNKLNFQHTTVTAMYGLDPYIAGVMTTFRHL